MEQRRQMEEHLKTLKYKTLIIILNFITRVCSIKLISRQEVFGENYEEVRTQKNWIVFDNPFASDYNLSSRSWTLRILHSSYILFVIYVAFKYSLMTYFHNQQDRYLERLRGIIFDGVSRKNGKCAIIGYYLPMHVTGNASLPLSSSAKVHYKSYGFYRDVLELMGDPTINVQGAGSLLLFMTSCATICFFTSGIVYLWKKPIRVDSIAFLTDILSEKERLERELSKIVEHFTETIKNYSRNSILRRIFAFHPDDQCCSLECSYPFERLSKKRKSAGNNQAEESMVNNETELFQLDKCPGLTKVAEIYDAKYLNYLRILFKTKMSNIVRPAHITAKTMKLGSSLFSACFLSIGIVTLFAANASIYFCLSIEFYARLSYRLDTVECRKWHKDAIPMDRIIQLSELESQEDKQFYSSYSHSNERLMDALAIELKFWMTPTTLMSLLEVYIILNITFFWCYFYISIFVSSYILKFYWVDQMWRQILETINFITRKREFELQNCSPQIDEKRFRDKLIEAITVTYLNFELFRRQNGKHQKVSNFLLLQTASVSIFSMLYCYLIGQYTSPSLKPALLVGCTFTVTILNMFLVLNSVIMIRFQSLLKSAMRLVVFSELCEIQDSLIIGMWRRQLLDEKELIRQYSTEIFGIYISNASILTVNLYLAALWWVLLGGKLH